MDPGHFPASCRRSVPWSAWRFCPGCGCCSSQSASSPEPASLLGRRSLLCGPCLRHRGLLPRPPLRGRLSRRGAGGGGYSRIRLLLLSGLCRARTHSWQHLLHASAQRCSGSSMRRLPRCMALTGCSRGWPPASIPSSLRLRRPRPDRLSVLRPERRRPHRLLVRRHGQRRRRCAPQNRHRSWCPLRGRHRRSLWLGSSPPHP